jgi:hypothetical protein
LKCGSVKRQVVKNVDTEVLERDCGTEENNEKFN